MRGEPVALLCFYMPLLAVILLRPPAAGAEPVDMEFLSIANLNQVAIHNGVVGFTLTTQLKNVGQNPIPWGFPVIESPANPWNNANRLTAFHEHVEQIGQHPHMRYSLYRQRSPQATTVRLGQSDLKHGVGVSGLLAHHALPLNHVDFYGLATNRNQNFYGPVEEMDPVTYEITAPEHFGSLYPDLGPGYHRDHGAQAFAGDPTIGMPADSGHPGTDNIDHLLQAPLDAMMPAAGAQWWLAGEVFVVDDVNQINNQRWIEVFPQWDGSKLTFTSGESGLGFNTIPGIPTPATIWIVGATGLVAFARRR